ncbi:cyanocobalamin reductase / alkylcobalamin dealkylase-like [Littorina saxatilis]|uniref:cyanocobalamin reductase / alkylcobalamin dealkylase-like n=1 Tax=Littorina saxatilis TaxID=31220 RepID=UPI0038B5DCB3
MAGHAEIHAKVSEILSAAGFEVHPFLIGWYNENVQTPFELPYDPDTLAFIIFSTPAMFDKAFKPFICRQSCDQQRDPIDECMIHHFNMVREAFPSEEIETLHDFEMTATRRPKVLVQTAGHVAGAAYYYQRKDVEPDEWDSKKKIYGVSIHPKYGGWFALRGVIIFQKVHQPDLPRREPEDCVKSREDRIKLLEGFNYNWQDWTYRDIVPAQDKYSEEQMKYFATMPKDRKEVVEEIKAKHCGDGKE